MQCTIGRCNGFVARYQVWTCGGTLLIVTCSHVGHVFRKATPYTFPGGTGRIINHNNARLADVWMDDWRNFFYRISPGSIGLPVDHPHPLCACQTVQCCLLALHDITVASIDKVEVNGTSRESCPVS